MCVWWRPGLHQAPGPTKPLPPTESSSLEGRRCGFLTLRHGVGAYSDPAFLQTCTCRLKDFSLRIKIGRYKREKSLSQLQMMQIYRFFGDLSKISLEPWRWLSLLLPLVGLSGDSSHSVPPGPDQHMVLGKDHSRFPGEQRWASTGILRSRGNSVLQKAHRDPPILA